jgi:hypothetical protein
MEGMVATLAREHATMEANLKEIESAHIRAAKGAKLASDGGASLLPGVREHAT